MVHPAEQPSFDIKQEAQKTLERLLPRLSEQFSEFRNSQPESWLQYKKRIQENFYPLFEILVDLYGTRYDFFFYLESLLSEITTCGLLRKVSNSTIALTGSPGRRESSFSRTSRIGE